MPHTRIYSSSGRKKLLSVFARTFRSATESGKSIRWAARLSRCSQEKGRIPFGRVKREIWNSCGGTPSRDFPPLSARPSNRGETSLFPHSLPPSLVPLSPNISPKSENFTLRPSGVDSGGVLRFLKDCWHHSFPRGSSWMKGWERETGWEEDGK